MAWTLLPEQLRAPRNPDALRDPMPMLRRLADAYGPRRLARLLDVADGTVSNWLSGARTLSPLMARRAIDLHDVLTRALQIYAADVAVDWLVGNDPYLEHRRPIDVLVLQGAGPLISALDAHATFGYA